MRHQYPALRTGKYKTLYADRHLYVFARILDEQEVLVAVNTGTEKAEAVATITGIQSQPQELIYGSGRLDWHHTVGEQKLEIVVPAKSSMIVA